MGKEPQVIRMGIFDAQVCVPNSFSNKQAEDFLEEQFPPGAGLTWKLREDEESLQGDPVRCQCKDHSDKVHITFDA